MLLDCHAILVICFNFVGESEGEKKLSSYLLRTGMVARALGKERGRRVPLFTAMDMGIMSRYGYGSRFCKEYIGDLHFHRTF